MIEEFTLKASSTASLSNTTQKTDGTLNAPVVFSRDIAAHADVVDTFVPAQRSLIDSPPFLSTSYSSFLNLDGVVGDSTDRRFSNQIQVVGFEWTMEAPSASMGSPTFGELHITDKVSKASPTLLSHLTSGTISADGDLNVSHAGANPTTLLSVDFDSAYVSSYRISVAADGSLVEEFTLGFANFTNVFDVYNDAGTLSGTTSFASSSVTAGTIESYKPVTTPLVDRPATTTNAFLKLNGIAGDSASKSHPSEIELNYFDWTADGAPGTTPVFGELHTAEAISKATSGIMTAIAANTSITSLDLAVRNDVANVDFLVLHMDSARVGSQVLSTGIGLPREEASFQFAANSLKFTPINPSGTIGAPVTASYIGGIVLDDSPKLSLMVQSNVTTQPTAYTLVLSLAGIAGESAVAGHVGEIDVRDFEWSIDRTFNGANAGGPDFSEVHLVTGVTKATPSLLRKLALAEHGVLRRRHRACAHHGQQRQQLQRRQGHLVGDQQLARPELDRWHR